MSHPLSLCSSLRALSPLARWVGWGSTSLAVLLAAGCLLGSATSGNAGESTPAAIAPVGNGDAHASFEKFARSWMQKMRKLEVENRRKAKPAAAGAERVTYQGYGEGFETELRETKMKAAPYVGILRYTERVYTCPSAGSRQCTISATIPVTEIFRFENGRWVY